MTKVRPPLSIDQALSRIAGQLPGGWAQMAEIAGCEERTVRNWSDPDTPQQVRVDAAIALDLAFQEHAGVGFPIFDAYALKLDVARAERFADEFEIARVTMESIHDSGEVHEALVGLTLPGSTREDRQNALRKVEDELNVLKRLIPLLATPTDNRGSGVPPNNKIAAGN